MPSQLGDKLVIAISSRALFDLDDSHAVFEREGLEAYRLYQIAHEDEPLEPGEAFPLVQKLLRINSLLEGDSRVEVGAAEAPDHGDRDEDGELSLFERLSEREMQIAMMVVDCQKVQDISDKLCLSPKTVNSYRYRIFEKLEISSDVELALMAVRLGLLDADKV